MGLLRLCVFGMPNVSHFSTLDGLQLQELPKGKDFGSIFCRFDGPNPDLRPPRKQVVTVVLIAPADAPWKSFTGTDQIQCKRPRELAPEAFESFAQLPVSRCICKLRDFPSVNDRKRSDLVTP